MIARKLLVLLFFVLSKLQADVRPRVEGKRDMQSIYCIQSIRIEFIGFRKNVCWAVNRPWIQNYFSGIKNEKIY